MKVMRINIEKIVYPGKSLGRCEDGLAAFTEGALPGETVDIEVTRDKKTFREGKLLNVIEPSAVRCAPECPSFGHCGGCSLQYADYAQQLEIKAACVRELLSQFGVPVEPIVASPAVWGYRNKMEFSFFDEGGVVSLGLHRKGEFNRYFPVPPCHIADPDFLPLIDAVVAFARGSGLPCYDKKRHAGFYRHLVVRKAQRTGQMLVNLVTNRQENTDVDYFAPLVQRLASRVSSFFWTINGSLSDAVVADEVHLLSGKEHIEEHLVVEGREYAFAISPFSFFQTNTLATEKLYEIVAQLFGGTKTDRLLDLYCGTGTIGIMLSSYVGSVAGVEQVPAAVENAANNSRLNGIANISFEAGSVEKWTKHRQPGDFNALVLDPPRGGISGKVVDFIARTAPEKIVYVSCNPSTLARDLKEIIEKGRYAIGRIMPVDMFPQTYHIETVVTLTKTH